MKHTRTLEVLILTTALSGETHLRISWLSPIEGPGFSLLRQSRKKPQGQPDPPQIVELVLENNANQTVSFIREWREIRNWRPLARSLPALQTWARLVRYLGPNLDHLDHYSLPYQLCLQALDALVRQPALCDTIELKTLYAFARNEGYPVRQDWFFNLSAHEQTTARTHLFSPLTDLASNTSPAPLVANLKRYLADTSHMIHS